MTIESINKPDTPFLKHALCSVLLFGLLTLPQHGQAIQVLSEDELRNSSELLLVDNTAGMQAEQLNYVQRENEQSNSNSQSPQTPSLLTVSSQQTMIQDARRAAEARNVDILQQRWLEYRKSLLAKDPTVIWFYSTY